MTTTDFNVSGSATDFNVSGNATDDLMDLLECPQVAIS
jgi:hypothetical protein